MVFSYSDDRGHVNQNQGCGSAWESREAVGMGVKTAKITDNHAGPTESSSQGEPFSFIRTMTVGFGIAPNLLTPPP